jgi:hypothetical protein
VKRGLSDVNPFHPSFPQGNKDTLRGTVVSGEKEKKTLLL